MECLCTIAESGADIIEIGYPFSDPIADGPTIQYAAHNALAHGVTLPDLLAALRNVSIEQPIVLMSYLNPLLAFGMNRLFDALEQAHVSGLIVPDLPVDEANEWTRRAASAKVNMIGLVAPTSTDKRIRLISERCSGFLYCISLTGTTGVRTSLPTDLNGFLGNVRSLTHLPTAVGFGIASPEHVRALQGKTDGVVVGSRIIESIRRGENISRLIQSLKEATRSCIHANSDAKERE
jgi:tryptophan synthase alpha chain